MPLDSHQEGPGPRDLGFTIDQEPEYCRHFLYNALRVIRLLFEVFQDYELAYRSDPIQPEYDPWLTVRFRVAPQVAKACYEAIPETFMENDLDAQAVIAEKLETLIFSQIMSSDQVSATLTHRTAIVIAWAHHSTILRLFPRDEIPRLQTLSNAEREAHLVELYQPFILEAGTSSRQDEDLPELVALLRRFWLFLICDLPPLCGVSEGVPVTGVPFVHFYPFALEVNADGTQVQGSFPMGVGLTLTPPCEPITWELSSDPQAFWKELFARLDHVIEKVRGPNFNGVPNLLTRPSTSPRRVRLF